MYGKSFPRKPEKVHDVSSPLYDHRRSTWNKEDQGEDIE